MSDPENNNTGAAPDPARSAMLALWLLLSTNSSFLLDQVQAAASAGATTVELKPGLGDTIEDWDDLITKLVAGDPGNRISFTQKNISTLLLNAASKELPDAHYSAGKTYLAILKNASEVFQISGSSFVAGWNPPCPRTIGEIPAFQPTSVAEENS